MFETIGYIQSVTPQGVVTIVAPTEKSYRIDQQEIHQARIIFDDERLMTAAQRKAIFATLDDICDSTGHLVEELENHFKIKLMAYTGQEYFTFSNKPKPGKVMCDVTTARLYLQMLIKFCLINDIPTSESLLSRAEDTGRYLYACLIHKKCCICGVGTDEFPADLHHVDSIGSANRATTEHIGREVMSLCRVHHDEAHRLGKDTFNKRYNVFGVKCDKTIAEKYNLRSGVDESC